MASCTGGNNSPGPMDPARIEVLAHELYKCVKKDQLVKAKFILKGLKKEEKRQIVNKLSCDGNGPLFVAAQQGQVHFVNYLIEECCADIELRGIYEVQEDRSKHKVTPLWCAAVANKLEVVKTLIRHNAEVNATSDTQSTPVRSACYMTNTEVVKYLVENGADIHKPNINGGTCLINSVQSVELCKFLIDKGASVNAQDNSGNLALHYAIREGRMETVKLLLKHRSDPYVKNDFGDDAIQTASLRGYSEVLEYLVTKIKPTVERQIEAYELMATNYVDEKHDILRAIQIWRKAMELRFQGEVVIEKPKRPPNPAYLNAVEASTMEELSEIATSPDAIYMHALLIRERILGPDHKDTIFGLMYRGAVYADTHRYQRCVDLWKYAFHLRHAKGEALNHECLFSLQALSKLFWEIYEEHVAGMTTEAVLFGDVMEVLQKTCDEVEMTKDILNVRPIFIHQHQEFQMLLQLCLHLIHLLCKIKKDEVQNQLFQCLVRKLLMMKVHGMDNRSLLHLAVDAKTSYVSEEFYSHFPSQVVVELLLACGSYINSTDEHGNTPLHICVESLRNGPLPRNGNDEKSIESIVLFLLDNGAFIYARNADNKVAAEELMFTSCRVAVINYVTLKCLAARVIQQHKLNYAGEVPHSLVPYIELH